jgi:hypothetical protein
MVLGESRRNSAITIPTPEALAEAFGPTHRRAALAVRSPQRRPHRGPLAFEERAQLVAIEIPEVGRVVAAFATRHPAEDALVGNTHPTSYLIYKATNG